MRPSVQSGALADRFQAASELKEPFEEAPSSPSKRRDLSPLTLRLTKDERTKLEDLAAGMTLSAYVRACVFGQEAKRRKRRPRDAVSDKRAAAEALALLGQSRIASNLNQLACHANIGVLEFGERERAGIAEANAHLLAIRTLLVRALGASSASVQGCETAASRCARTRSHRDHSEVSE